MTITTWSDVLRFLTLCAAFIALGSTLGVVYQARRLEMSRPQLARFLSFGIFLGSVVATECLRLHHVANWHTWTDFFASFIGWYGVSALLRKRRQVKTGLDAGPRERKPF